MTETTSNKDTIPGTIPDPGPGVKSTGQKATNYGLGIACVVFLVIAAWYISGVMSDMNSYADWDKPKEVAQIIKGMAWGGIGFLLALGVNFFDIVQPLLAVIPGLKQLGAPKGPTA